jgi:DNA-binding Lrp family transcriptional regulator
VHNPVVRHTVLRRRQTLEDAGLLERIGVDVHPDPDAAATSYTGVGFNGLGLLTSLPFDLAYQAAEAFTAALQQRTKAAGFMKTLLLQRICSSFASGRSTAERMLRREMLEDEEQAKLVEEALSALTPNEARYRRTIVEELSRLRLTTPNSPPFTISSRSIAPKERPGWNTVASFSASTTIPRTQWWRTWRGR